MKNKTGFIFVSLFLVGLLAACQQKSDKFGSDDNYTSGNIKMVADESFAPLLDQELYVFKALNKEARPQLVYKNENDVLRLFLNDSVRFALLARNITPEELAMLRQKALPPEVNCFAYDAVALIINQTSSDTLTSVKEIKSMLNGQSKTDINIVFDNPNSSITRYLKELSGNGQLKQKNIYALNSNVEVIKYVSEHPMAVGFISYSWLLEPEKNYAALVNKIKVISVKDESNKGAPDKYFKPSQNTLAMRQYPLIRPLYIINTTGRAGLGKGFASFMLGEKGQRIVLRSGLLPDSIPTREVSFSK